MKHTPSRISMLLWIVNLSSISASVFSYVYLADVVYRQTGSAVLSQAVLIAPMVVPVVLCLVINTATASRSPKPVLAVLNFSGIVVAAVTYALVDHAIAAAIVGALVIGFLDATQRVARTVAIKRYFSTEDIKYALPITLTAQFIAGAVAGIALSIYKSEITPALAGVLTMAAFGVGTLAALLLPSTHAEQQSAMPAGAFGTFMKVLRTTPILQRHFVAFLIVVSIFQGFFNVSRVTLPAQLLELPQSYVGYLQIISATSALIAALLFALASKRGVAFGKLSMVVMNIICLTAMVGSTAFHSITFSYFFYFIYMFLWEVLFFKHQSDVVETTPSENMSLVATFQYASVYLGMIVIGFVGSWLSSLFGLLVTAVVFSAIYVVLIAWNAVRNIGDVPESVYVR